MKKKEIRTVPFIIVLLILIFTSVPAYAADHPADHASWWIKRYGEVKPGDNKLAERAVKVFERVLAASDKNGLPRLIIVKTQGNPWAIAIRDSSAIVSEGALTLCYKGVSEEKGDARLAFVLGHELSHLAKYDFWHSFAYAAISDHADQSKADSALREQLKETPKDIRNKELQADYYGIINMTIAGYNPGLIVNDSTNFFEDWESQITRKIAYSEDEDHPSPEARAKALRSQLKSVADDLGLFTFGVRYYQTGRYDDAIDMLEAFSRKFPGREVFNNLGLSHYQLAMKALSACDKSLALRFKLPSVLDTETAGKSLRSGDSGASSCLGNEIFQKHIKTAIKHFETAIDKDLTYMPARINLSSALIMEGDHTKVMAVADEALKIQPQNADAMNNKAIALYLWGKAKNMDTADKAIEILNGILSKEPVFISAFYNIAAIQSERAERAERGKEAAAEAMKSFLKIENTGIFADEVKKRLGITSGDKAPEARPPDPESPVIPGDITDETKKILQGMKKREFSTGGGSGEIYENGITGIKVLVIDDTVEIVETIVSKPVDLAAFRAKYGEPAKEVQTLLGITIVYDNFVADVIDGKVERMAYFSRWEY